MTQYLTADALVAFVSLSAMEVVLGIDNIVFIAILAGKLREEDRQRARLIGIGIAVILRIGLLLTLSWAMDLKEPLFQLLGRGFSGKDLILLAGGLFLIGKATNEIYEKLEGGHEQAQAKAASFKAVVAQIVAIDIVFSIDAVVTAVGMAQQIPVMIAAVLFAVTVMLIFADKVARFIDKHPSLKILALSFLLLIGVMLAAEGMGQHVGKGYIYAAMGFSLLVEMLNMRFRRKHAPLHLHQSLEA